MATTWITALALALFGATEPVQWRAPAQCPDAATAQRSGPGFVVTRHGWGLRVGVVEYCEAS